MKKMLRILTAAMLITASLPMSTVFAEGDTNNALWYWGTATQDTFSSMERIDSWSGLDMTFCTPAEQHETYLSDHSIYMVSSQDRLLQFKLRDDVDTVNGRRGKAVRVHRLDTLFEVSINIDSAVYSLGMGLQ